MKILVVDDTMDIQWFFKENFSEELKSGEFSIQFVHSGEETLEILTIPGIKDIGLVLVDYNLPGMSSINLIKYINLLTNKCLPVIIIVPFDLPQYRMIAYKHGAIDYVNKPISPVLLRKKISHLTITLSSKMEIPNISRQQIVKIFEQIAKEDIKCAAGNITIFDLSHRQLPALPPEIANLTGLTELNLSKNQLSSLPSEISRLSKLTYLDLSNNQLATFPSEIVQLTKLKHLDLSKNYLTTLPSAIGKLIDLDMLDVSNNKLTDLPLEIKSLPKLKSLRTKGNLLLTTSFESRSRRKHAPEVAGNVSPLPSQKDLNESKLKKPHIRHTNFTANEAEVIQLIEQADKDNVRSLDLSDRKISNLPREIGRLVHLTKLVLKGNNLTILPAEIYRLKQLEELELGDNQITEISPLIGKLSKLTKLNIEDNQLSELPEQFGQLTNLRELYLGHNKLLRLPSQIVRLVNLVMLDLRNNQLSMLPPGMEKLKNLRTFALEENLLSIPPEIIALEDEPVKIINYYQQHQSKQKRALNEAKVIIVGQGAVGKTSIVKRLLEDKFDTNESKTEGIDIKRWDIKIDDTKIHLNIWDFGGQEIMHATHQFFLTKRSLYLLVLDSRLDEQENRVEYWLKMIRSFGGDSPIIVVCNKSDQHNIDLDWRGLQTKYPTINRFIKNVSCKTGYGIFSLAHSIKQEVARLEHIHDELSVNWFTVKTRLEEIDIDYISYEEYLDICRTEGIVNETSQQTLLGFLHDLGIVLHFHDHPILEDTNVLNPEWVTTGVYQILNSHELFQQKGILKRETLSRILSPERYPRNKHQFIIDIMRKFELCFNFEGGVQDQFLVPDLLPKEEPYTGEWNNSLAFQYQYDILPSSVISRFIVRMHTYISRNTYWRNGVVLTSEDRNNIALVKADIEDKKMFIHIKGKSSTRHTFLEIIRSDFRKIHKTIPKLIIKEIVTLPNRPNIEIDYKGLIRLKEKGVKTHYYPEADAEINLEQLLGCPIQLKNDTKIQDEKRDIEAAVVVQRLSPQIIMEDTTMAKEIKAKTENENVNIEKKEENTPNNPWIAGSFYLLVFIVVMSALAVISQFVAWQILPIVLIAGLLTIPLIGVLQALNDGTLSEEGFLKVVLESYKLLPLLRKDNSKKLKKP
ncbi:MAG: COR domain-containing protein [Candidatus Hodarchaeota archaeon]